MEGLNSFLQVGGFVIAMLTIYRALSEYSKNNLFRRATILEELIKKFKEKKLYVAKRLLDDFVGYYYDDIDNEKAESIKQKALTAAVTIVHSKLRTPVWELEVADNIPVPHVNEPGGKSVIQKPFIYRKEGVSLETAPPKDDIIVGIATKLFPNVKHFTFISMEHLLRNHVGDLIEDSEVYFRDSFDELLDFYLLLIYYLRNEIITIREVHAHFLFHLLSVKKCTALLKYIELYYDEEDFNWLFKQLNDVKPEDPGVQDRTDSAFSSDATLKEIKKLIIENH